MKFIKFSDWIKLKEQATSTGDIANFSRPLFDKDEKKKKNKKEKKKSD